MRKWYKPNKERDLMAYVFRPFQSYNVDMRDGKWYNPIWRDDHANWIR